MFNTGEYYLHMYVHPPTSDPLSGDSKAAYAQGQLTQLAVPKLEAFNLMGDGNNKDKKRDKNTETPVPHWRSRVTLSVMTDDISLDRYSVPGEIHQYVRHNLDPATGSYLPIAIVDGISFRLKDLQVCFVKIYVLQIFI